MLRRAPPRGNVCLCHGIACGGPLNYLVIPGPSLSKWNGKLRESHGQLSFRRALHGRSTCTRRPSKQQLQSASSTENLPASVARMTHCRFADGQLNLLRRRTLVEKQVCTKTTATMKHAWDPSKVSLVFKFLDHYSESNVRRSPKVFRGNSPRLLLVAVKGRRVFGWVCRQQAPPSEHMRRRPVRLRP